MGLFGASAEKVLDKGTSTSGRLVAIKVEQSSEGESTVRVDTYTVETQVGQRFVVRQRLAPDDVVRLGMAIDLRVLKDDAVIDWKATMARAGVSAANDTHKWKMGKDEGNGINDRTLRLDKKARNGVATDVEILAVTDKKILMGLASTNAFTLLVHAADGAYETVVDIQVVPHYATHLATIGARLPGIVDGRRLDKVAIDWASAAERDPGVGRPPSTVISNGAGTLFGGGRSDTVSSMSSGGAPSAPAEAASAPPSGVLAPPIEGVTFETYAEIESRMAKAGVKPKEWDAFAQRYGVPAGRWSDISMQWRKQMMRNVQMQQVMGVVQQRVFAEP